MILTKSMYSRYGRLYGKIYDDNKVDEEIYSYTVESNTKLYTKRQIHDADKARKFQHDMGYVPTSTLATMILSGSGLNTPITAQDLLRADEIYGVAVPTLKGTTKTRQLDRVRVQSVPRLISTRQSLHIDIMFICNIPFLVGYLEPIGLTVVSHLSFGKRARSAGV
jgi:hypothetical protein